MNDVLVSAGHPAPDWTRTPAGTWTGTSIALLVGFYSLEHLWRSSGIVLMPHASCSGFTGFYIPQTVGTSSGQTPKIGSF